METRSWVAVGVLLVALLVLERTGADYVWDGEQWQWFVKSSYNLSLEKSVTFQTSPKLM